MFEDLRSYPRIAVTGPQRSGTRIAAQMIAADTGHRYVDEAEFQFIDETAWADLLFPASGVVVQCPSMFKPLMDRADDDVFVVVMRRPLSEIHASQARIEWNRFEVWELGRFGVADGDSAALKYEYWDTKPRPPHHLEISYASLSSHPAFVPADRRAEFGPYQTEVG